MQWSERDESFKLPYDRRVHYHGRGELHPAVDHPMSNRGQPVIAPVFPKPLCEVCERLLVMEFFGLRPSRFGPRYSRSDL